MKEGKMMSEYLSAHVWMGIIILIFEGLCESVRLKSSKPKSQKGSKAEMLKFFIKAL